MSQIEHGVSTTMKLGGLSEAVVLTLVGTVVHADFSDPDWGEPPEEKPWIIGVSVRIDGLRFGRAKIDIDDFKIGADGRWETEQEAEIARGKAMLQAVRLLYEHGVLTQDNLNRLVFGSPQEGE